MKTQRIVLSALVAVLCGFVATGCASVQGTRQDYFGYRNTIPAPEQDASVAQNQTSWQNPLSQNQVAATRVAFVPVITPWYDSFGFAAGWGARSYWSTWDYWSFNSFNRWNSWGWGPSFGFGLSWGSPWGWNSPFGLNSAWYSPSYGFGGFNPYWGYRGYRPFYAVNNVTIINNGGFTDVPTRQTPTRDFGMQRPFAGGANTGNFNTAANNGSTYIGTFDAAGTRGGRYRDGAPTRTTYSTSYPTGFASDNAVSAPAKTNAYQQGFRSNPSTYQSGGYQGTQSYGGGRGWGRSGGSSGSIFGGGSSAPSKSSGSFNGGGWSGGGGSSRGSSSGSSSGGGGGRIR